VAPGRRLDALSRAAFGYRSRSAAGGCVKKSEPRFSQQRCSFTSLPTTLRSDAHTGTHRSLPSPQVARACPRGIASGASGSPLSGPAIGAADDVAIRSA
jgi:hypothetical protein